MGEHQGSRSRQRYSLEVASDNSFRRRGSPTRRAVVHRHFSPPLFPTRVSRAGLRCREGGVTGTQARVARKRHYVLEAGSWFVGWKDADHSPVRRDHVESTAAGGRVGTSLGGAVSYRRRVHDG